jgi:hypothetical protein
MSELIWFSIPGALILLALGDLQPNPLEAVDATLVIASAPVIGFLIHQFFRMLFELRICRGYLGGYAGPWRRINQRIATEYKLGKDYRTAHLIWEVTFYNNAADGFREHDRGCWHYVMSFYSTTTAAVIGIIVLLAWGEQSHASNTHLLLMIGAGGVCAVKGLQTVRAIGRQEVGMFAVQWDNFNRTAHAFMKRGVDWNHA